MLAPTPKVGKAINEDNTPNNSRVDNLHIFVIYDSILDTSTTLSWELESRCPWCKTSRLYVFDVIRRRYQGSYNL
jgi:hypothetical protein